MLPPNVINTVLCGDLQQSTEEGEVYIEGFKGLGYNMLEARSPSEAYQAQFCHNEIDLLKDHYQKGTNEWAAERKKRATDENKLNSQWMRQPDEGVDINSIKLDIVLTWAANLLGQSFESFFSKGMFDQNKFGGMLEKVTYYKFALVHCARRVHTPQMD